jgi:Ca2+-binding RTX toxin-like protein
VTVTTTPQSATAGADFTPIARTVHFGPDERTKTVQIDARADGAAEPAETYAVTLSAPEGDAWLGIPADAQPQVIATIPASAADQPDADQPDGGQSGGGQSGGGQPDGGHQDPPPPSRCAGRAATIVGTARADVLRGTPGPDVIVALGGNDTITGARGDDVVCAGRGNDRVRGDRGRDRLFGGPGNDRLSGGAGRDACAGGIGRDRATCERKTSA